MVLKDLQICRGFRTSPFWRARVTLTGVPWPLVLEVPLAFYRPAFDKRGDGVVAFYGNIPQVSTTAAKKPKRLSLITVELTFAMENSSKPSFSFSGDYHTVALKSIYFFI